MGAGDVWLLSPWCALSWQVVKVPWLCPSQRVWCSSWVSERALPVSKLPWEREPPNPALPRAAEGWVR